MQGERFTGTHREFHINYNSAVNAPILLQDENGNDYPIGIVKSFNPNGYVECVIWGRYVIPEFQTVEYEADSDGTANITALYLGENKSI